MDMNNAQRTNFQPSMPRLAGKPGQQRQTTRRSANRGQASPKPPPAGGMLPPASRPMPTGAKKPGPTGGMPPRPMPPASRPMPTGAKKPGPTGGMPPRPMPGGAPGASDVQAQVAAQAGAKKPMPNRPGGVNARPMPMRPGGKNPGKDMSMMQKMAAFKPTGA